MKVFEVLRETTEQEIAQAAKGMVAKAKAGDIGGAADDMERVHNSIARMDIGSGLYDFMQKTLKQLKSLVASNPNHLEAPKFVQAIKDIEAGLPAMKQAAADSRRMAVDAGAGRQDVGEGILDLFSRGADAAGLNNIGNMIGKTQADDITVARKAQELLDQGMPQQEIIRALQQEFGVNPRAARNAISYAQAGLLEGRLKSRSYKKSYKAAKASGRRRMKHLRDSQEDNASEGAAILSRIDMALDGSGLKRQGFELVKDPNSFTRGSITREALAMIKNALAKAKAMGAIDAPDPAPVMNPADIDDSEFEGMYETATAGGTSAGAIATVSNPSVTRNVKKPKKNKNGTAQNAQDSNANLMTGQVIKR